MSFRCDFCISDMYDQVLKFGSYIVCISSEGEGEDDHVLKIGLYILEA